jgi:HAD superfamily hydrolase (TIGR01509 family)
LIVGEAPAPLSRRMIFPRQIRAVVFDMDGLLIDTEVVIRGAMRAAAIDFGAELPDAVFIRMVGLTIAAGDEVAQAHFGPDFPLAAYNAEVTRRAHAVFEVEDLLKSGVREIIDHLEGLGIPKAVATSSPPEAVRRHLAPAGLYDRFQTIVARGDYPRGKPNPDPYLVAAQRLGVEACDCLALEDSHNGVRAAHAAGMMTVMVPDLLEPTDEMREKCVAVMQSLHEVRRALGEAESG